MYACSGVTCHLHFWQNDQSLFLRATAVTWGWNDTEEESAHKVNSGEKNSHAAPAGIQTHNLSNTSLVLLPTAVLALRK